MFMRLVLKILLILSFCSICYGQNVRLFQFTTDASGSCQLWNLAQNINTGSLFYCKSTPPTTAWTSIPVGQGNLNIGMAGLIINGILYADTTQTAVSLPQAGNGQLLIGNNGNHPTVANLTAGTGIGIGNGAGSITLSASGVPSSSLNITATNCTNQVVTAINSSAIGTCASVSNAMLSNNSVTFNGVAVALGSTGTLILSSSNFANQGTTTTVLHGNAAGNPNFTPVVEADLNLTDLTTANSSTSAHGFLKKLSGAGTDCMLGTGNWGSCSGASGGVSSITGTTAQVIANTCCGAVTLSLPQSIATTSNPQFFDLGLGVAAPTSGGQLKSLLGANNITAILINRNTDSSPTGNFLDLQTNGGSSLFKVDITGTVVAGVWNGTAIANANLANSSITITAGTGLTGGGTPALGGSTTLSLSTPVSLTNGGTNAALTASNGGIFYSTGSAGAILSGTSTANQILLSGASTTPAWSTATYPATAGTSNNCLVSNGTNWSSTACPTSNTTYTNETSSFNASSNTAYWISANSLTATLPASPNDNDWIIFVNGVAVTSGTTTIAANGKSIQGLAQNMTIDVSNFAIKLVYRNASGDWRITD